MGKSSSLKTKTLTLMLKVARLRALKPLVKLFFNHMDLFLAVERLDENAHWVAFHHPDPAYPLHILLVSKQAIPTLTAAPVKEPHLYKDLFTLARALVQEFDLETKGYRLIMNGGPNQTIPQWHCHLISGESDNPTGQHPPSGDTHA